jgi:pyruvate dehydrogenase E1 component alpha subunit/2-oxoisovalerate dehydrogenase E1 component alpha subunit
VATPAARRSPLPAGWSGDALLEIYYYLRLTRSLEERLVNLYRQSKVIGGLYCSLGQEGQSVASAYALEPGDILSPLIRNVGSMLVMGAAPVDLFRQYMAKASGPTQGRDTNVHFADLEKGYLGNISHLGDMIPVMAGIALSFKLRGERRVGLVHVGDGASSTGAFHEGMNLAAVQRVPLVVIVEHNGYAYSTPTSRQTAVKRLAAKAKAYGVPAETVDGNDVFPVYDATERAVERARRGEGVTLIEVVTYRRKGHAEHDDQRYQPKEEREQWARQDPIDRYVSRLVAEGWATQAELQAADRRVTAELDAAVAAAETEPLPRGDGALAAVLADPPEAERLWYRRR